MKLDVVRRTEPNASVAPSQERELKYREAKFGPLKHAVAPSQERELKLRQFAEGVRAIDVAPSQERELKFEEEGRACQVASRSFTGA